MIQYVAGDKCLVIALPSYMPRIALFFSGSGILYPKIMYLLTHVPLFNFKMKRHSSMHRISCSKINLFTFGIISGSYINKHQNNKDFILSKSQRNYFNSMVLNPRVENEESLEKIAYFELYIYMYYIYAMKHECIYYMICLFVSNAVDTKQIWE